MTPDSFDWGRGEVVYWDLYGVDARLPIDQQLDELKEDLAQVQFDADKLLDIGWFPEFSVEGAFVVSLVRNQDWDEPIYRKRCVNLHELGAAVAEAVRIAQA